MSQKWTITGRIVVDHVLPELQAMLGTRSGVGGMTVKVSARSKIPFGWGTWSSWGTVTAGPDGRFRVTKERGSDRRQFKVQILFDSNRLRIKEGKETRFALGSDGFPIDIHIDLTDKDWHEAYSDKDADAERKAGLHDLGDIRLSRDVVRKHADLWILYNKVIDLMASYGAGYAFKDKVVVKYPMSLSGGTSSSYWNPLNGHGYIKENQFTTYTVLHELMHKWEYDHCTGENAMAWQLLKHQDTHQRRENTTYVPFLESFADWAAVKCLQAVSEGQVENFLQGAPFRRPDHPFSRQYIGGNLGEQERNLANLDYTERGWYGLFTILTFPWLDRIDVDRVFTDTQGEHSQYAFLSLFSAVSDLRLGYSFRDILSVFLPAPGHKVDALLATREMNFRDFLDRAGSILPGFDAGSIKRVKSMLNPSPRVARPVAAGV